MVNLNVALGKCGRKKPRAVMTWCQNIRTEESLVGGLGMWYI
jgi:hypothetical protein